MNQILLTICARGDSRGIKNKNIRLLKGKPLISYTINQALQWGRAAHVIVSTDSPKIAEISRKFGAEIPFIRPRNLATDSTPKLKSIRHALLKCEAFYKKEFNIIVDLDPTAPVRKTEDINKSFHLFLKYRPKSLFSVVNAKKNPYFNMVEKDNGGRVHISKRANNLINRRQDSPQVYEMNASIYIFRRDYIMNAKNTSSISDDSIMYLMNDISSVDIDREIDFKFVEFLMEKSIVTI